MRMRWILTWVYIYLKDWNSQVIEFQGNDVTQGTGSIM